MSKSDEKKQETPVTEKASKPKVPAVESKVLDELLGDVVLGDGNFSQGLSNLATLPEVHGGKGSKPIFNRPFAEGVMGFRREDGGLKLTVACGTAQAQSISLSKYVAMVERMYDPDRPTIVLQSPSDGNNSRSGRGQLLGRVVPQSSAIVIGLGFTGRIVSEIKDFVKVDVYYLDRAIMASFYIAARTQLKTENTLSELIAANEGWYRFGIPENPVDPYELEGPQVKKVVG